MARRPRALILGLPYFSNLLRGVLQERGWETDYMAHPGRNPRSWAALLPKLWRADVLYHITSRVDRLAPQALLSRVWRRPYVIHWVGTDVLVALEAHRKGKLDRHFLRRANHWVDAPWLGQELQEIGVEAVYQPLPVVSLSAAAPPPLPEEFRALLYLPEHPRYRRVFDVETLLRLPHELPEIQFTLVPSRPHTLPGPLPANLRAPGWIDDMDPIYRQASVLVRLTEHDGTSFMALEAMSRGRHVIWTYPMTGVIQAKGLAAVTAALRGLFERHKRGELAVNEDGLHHAREHFDPAHVAVEIDQRLRDLLRARRKPGR
ncbi:MAG: hypothetical protein M0R74_14825 [Dehalococcoidia bacterium]|nr:hypothetical protein [Dehalococcoidia bacterium]